MEREVVAIRRIHPGHGREGLIETPRGARLTDGGLFDELHGLGDLVDRRVAAGDGDDGWGQRVHLEAVRGAGGGVPPLRRPPLRPNPTERDERPYSPQGETLRPPSPIARRA